MRSWRISTTSGACWSLWSRLPPPPPRSSARRSACSSRGAGSSRACSGRWTRILVAGIGKGIAVFMTLRGAVGAAIIGFANLKEAWTLLTAAFSANPYLLAIGAAVTLAVVVMDNWDAVKAFLLGVWDAVASGVRAAVGAVASAFDNAVNFATGAGSAIAGAVGPAVSSAMGFVGAAVSGAAESACLGVRRRGGRGVRPVLGHGRGDRDCLAGDHGRLPAPRRARRRDLLRGSFRRAGCGDRAVPELRGNGPRRLPGARGRHPRRPVLPVGQGHGGVPGLRRVGVGRCGIRGFGLLRCGGVRGPGTLQHAGRRGPRRFRRCGGAGPCGFGGRGGCFLHGFRGRGRGVFGVFGRRGLRGPGCFRRCRSCGFGLLRCG